jgi:hypothetical protein
MNKQYNLEQIKNWKFIGRGKQSGSLVAYLPEVDSHPLLTPGTLYLWDGEIAGVRGASSIVDNRGHKFWGIPTKDFRSVPEDVLREISQDFS